MYNLTGIAYQLFSIIVLGDYNPALVSDGSAVHEDSAVYDIAYQLAYQLGTITPPWER